MRSWSKAGTYLRVFGEAVAIGISITCSAGAAPQESEKNEKLEPVPAYILKIEGEGIANVRKKSGIIEAAGARGKIFTGDRILTDERSAVHLLLNDGTVIKIGFNSDLKLAKVGLPGKFLSWDFFLAQGSIRALVEKLPASENRLRVETPVGTVGVSGTEFVLSYDETAGASYLYGIEGVVEYGANDCEKNKGCALVRRGECSSIKRGQKGPTAPHGYEAKELFSATHVERISLFRDPRKITEKYVQGLDPDMFKKLMEESIVEFAAAQDRAIGRGVEQRMEMQELAAQKGALENIFTAADAFAEARGVFHSKSNGGAENLIAQVMAAKYRLGDAVKKAEAAGVFIDSKPGELEKKGAPRSYAFRKNVDYSQSIEAKGRRADLEKSLAEYRAVLEFMEALQEEATEGAETVSPVPSRACDSQACMVSRMIHELEVASEGFVAAYAKSDGRASGKANVGMISTVFFSRTIPGNGCFKTDKTCKAIACGATSAKKKCKAGETVQVCTVKQVPIRCPIK